jgi:hypothetical protein
MTQLSVVSFDRVGIGFAKGNFVTAKVIPECSVGIEAITEIESCLGRFIDECLELFNGAIPDDFPAQNTASEPIYDGYYVDPVFLCSIKVNTSSISAVSTFSGTGAAGS